MTEALWAQAGWPPPLSSLTPYAGFLFYLAPGDNRRPDPTRDQLQAYLGAGLDLAPIWQHAKIDIAAGGFELGVDHARRANADADLKAVPAWVPIIYACDADRTFAQVEQYYRGVMSVAGRPVGAYGGGKLLADLRAQLGVRWLMQAASRGWAGNATASLDAQWWQRDPNVTVAGGMVDQVVPLAPYPTWKAGPLPMTRALYYPPADRTTQWFAGAYPGSIMALTAPVIVGHSTEGGYGWPTYSGGAVAPTLTALPILAEKRLAWRQHFPVNMSARALKNLAGGVQTNTAGAVQIELCGTCVKGGPGMYWPEAPDWALRQVADFIAWFRSEWPMPQGLRLPPRGFRLYEQIGNDAQRMTFDEWVNFSGVCEHQNVPENDHGDASGAWGKAVALLTNPPPPPPSGDWFDMATTQDLEQAVIRVLRSPEARLMRAWESGGQPSVPVLMCSTEGGKIYSLMPGQPKHWLSPEEWALLTRLFPQNEWLTDAARPWSGRFLESEIDQVWALLQPANAAGVDTAAVVSATVAAVKETLSGVDVDEAELARQIIAQLAAPAAGSRELEPDYRGMTVDQLEAETAPAEAPADAPDLDKSAPSTQDDTPGHDGPTPA